MRQDKKVSQSRQLPKVRASQHAWIPGAGMVIAQLHDLPLIEKIITGKVRGNQTGGKHSRQRYHASVTVRIGQLFEHAIKLVIIGSDARQDFFLTTQNVAELERELRRRYP